MAKKPISNERQADLFDDWLVADEPVAVEKPVAKISETEISQDQARHVLALRLEQRLAADGEITSKTLTEEANKAFGGTQAEGRYSSKDAYDSLEAAFNIHLLGTESAGWTDLTAAQAQAKIIDLTGQIQKLPTQTRRDDEMDEFQQFSTPPALSFLANWAANVRADDVMAEPSAGTGDLAVWSRIAGAEVVLNELSPRRQSLLAAIFPQSRLFKENAEQLDNVLPADVKPTVIVMNPPFSSTAGRVQGQRDSTNGAKHIEQALRRLEDGGRLVAIVGNGMAADKPAFASWWKDTQAKYNVRANIGISGREYAKYGTTFDNQILVIDKNGATTQPVLTGNVDSVADLPALLEGIRNDRQNIKSSRTQSTSDEVTGARTNPLQPGNRTGRPSVNTVGAGNESVGDGRNTGAGITVSETGGAATISDGANDSGRAGDRVLDGTVANTGGSGSGDTGGNSGVTQGQNGIVVEATTNTVTEFTESVFANYQPQRLKIAGARPHPGKLVQSAAMSAVEPPAPTYTPALPKSVIDDGLLSIAQLESVVYAGQAHSQQMPNGARKGFFIGDGTGVGKGREISGIILDNMEQGRKKAVWVSFNDGLLQDAKRDFAGIGGNPDKLFSQGKIKAGAEITQQDGILFTTYSMLRGGEKKQANDLGQKGGKTRVQQIIDWLGEGFDGVIAFDEAHSMGNAIAIKGARGTRKPSQQAIAGINLQKSLPNARVTYVSATGATEISNLSYAERLGLWGEGTPFADTQSFINGVSKGGIASMELISRDMKAMGMYLARSLSYDGVSYERLEHKLSDLQEDIYNELAGAWQVVLNNVEQALEITQAGKSGQGKSAAMSQFWGAHQRFFNQIITAMQTPAVIDHMREQIEAGHVAVIQLVNTNEAAQERIVAEASANDTPLEELDFTPRQMLMDYVRNGFPVAAYDETKDGDGNVSYVPVRDSEGNPVFDREAIRLRDALLETLTQIRVPENPLDSIVNAFGSDRVAEVTGRSRRFVQTRDDQGDLKIVEEKRGKNSSRADAEAFQDNKKDVLIFSGAGGTGYSFHADNTAINQRKRVHYILQPGWQAHAAVQGFGRTHRTNQAQEPHYVLPTTNLQAQKRFVSSIARRLDQLGALTRGQREATSQGMFTASDNLESEYASIGLHNFFTDLYRGKTSLNFHDVTKQMGLSLVDENGSLNESKLPAIPQFLNRLLSLKTDMQNAVFDEFETRLVEAVEYAKQQGTYDVGLQTVRALSIVKTRDDVAYEDQNTGATTRYVELAVTNEVKYDSWEKIRKYDHKKRQEDDASGFYVFEHGKNKGNVFYMSDVGQRLDGEGKEVRRGVIYGIKSGEHRYVDNADVISRGWDFQHVDGRYQRITITKAIDTAEAEKLWKEQVAAAPKTEVKTERMLVGVMMPIWDRVKGKETIVRLQTDDGEQLLGRMLGAKAAQETLRNLGLDSGVSKLSSNDLFEAIKKGGKAILSNGWEISTAKVNQENRIEIKGRSSFTDAEKRILKEQGAFSERINWADRVFIPTGEDGLSVFTRITQSRPVVDLIGIDTAQLTQGASVTPTVQESQPFVPLDAPEAPIAERVIGEVEPQPRQLVEFMDVTRGAYSGQLDQTLIAAVGGVQVGKLDYSLYNGIPAIQIVEVEPDHRRMGFATELVKQLQRQFPNTEIEWGALTEDGKNFRESLRITEKPSERAADFERLNIAIAERDRLLSEAKYFNDLTNPTPEQIETYSNLTGPLNSLHDLIYDLENELSNQSATVRLIDTENVNTLRKSTSTDAEPIGGAANSQPLPDGWTESAPGGLITNTDPVKGGIIDSEIVSGKWFVIPNSDAIQQLNGFDTRDDALAALEREVVNITQQDQSITADILNSPANSQRYNQEAKPMADKIPFHQQVADNLIKQLEQGTSPWQRPWDVSAANSLLPYNPTTGNRYKGINTLHLMGQDRDDQRWLTYNQASSMGAQVRKGEKGTTVQYWIFTDQITQKGEDGKPIMDEKGEAVKITVRLERPKVFYATVFNAEQIDGMPPIERKPQTWEPIERAEKILTASKANISHNGGNRAYYRSSTDSIHLPDRGQFPNAENYYATALHELGHWTGHESRLDRDLGNPFGSEAYAKEELRAEIASMIIGDELGIGHDPGQHAAYVGSWIKALREDPMEIFRAAADAEKIQSYVIGLEQKQEQELDLTADRVLNVQQTGVTMDDSFNVGSSEHLIASTISTIEAAQDGIAEWRSDFAKGDGNQNAQIAIDYAKAGHIDKAMETLWANVSLEDQYAKEDQYEFRDAITAIENDLQVWQRANGVGSVVTPAMKADFDSMPRDLSQLSSATTEDYQNAALAAAEERDLKAKMDGFVDMAISTFPSDLERAKRLASTYGLTDAWDSDNNWFSNDSMPLDTDAVQFLNRQAESFAYEAGELARELDASTPERLLSNQLLADAFERGKAAVAGNEYNASRATDGNAMSEMALPETVAAPLPTADLSVLGPIADHIAETRRLADDINVTKDIEQLAFTGMSATQIAEKLEDRITPVVDGSLLPFVRQVRTSLGIPPSDSTLFESWRDSVSARLSASETGEASSESLPRLDVSALGDVGDAINRARDIADRLGLTAEIEKMAFDGMTTTNIANTIESRLDKDSRQAIAGSQDSPMAVVYFVRQVSMSLGVPPNDDVEAFAKWQNDVRERLDGQVIPDYQKAAAFAREHEEAVKNDPRSTSEDIATAREQRKTAELEATLNNEAFQQKVSEIEQKQQADANKGDDRAYINVPYREKEEAKGLGAKWDRGEQSWYVPAGVDLSKFAKWNQPAPKPEQSQAEQAQAVAASVGNTDRQYLAVPYTSRNEAKAAGALWDTNAKSWYAGPRADMEKLKVWLPENVKSQQEPAMTPREEFAEALAELGCVVDGKHPVMDGTKQRIATKGDKDGEKAGFYVAHLDGHPAGFIQNNRTGESLKWKAKGYGLSEEDKAKLMADSAIKLQQRDVQATAKQNAVAESVRDLLNVSPPAPADHQYLQSKNVRSGDLKVVPVDGSALPADSMVMIGKNWRESNQLREANPEKLVFTAGDLLLSAQNANGDVRTVQTIQSSGMKRFAAGGEKQGTFHVIGGGGNGLDDLQNVPAIVIGEGYATADTLSQALGYPTVAAFDSGNLPHVAEQLHNAFPDKPVVIAGDNDLHQELTEGKNPGREKAVKAAELVNGTAIFPVFAPGEQTYPSHLPPVTPTKARAGDLSEEQHEAIKAMKGFTDFNDLATKSAFGRDGVERQVTNIVNDIVERHEQELLDHQQQQQEQRNQDLRDKLEQKHEQRRGIKI